MVHLLRPCCLSQSVPVTVDPLLARGLLRVLTAEKIFDVVGRMLLLLKLWMMLTEQMQTSVEAPGLCLTLLAVHGHAASSSSSTTCRREEISEI